MASILGRTIGRGFILRVLFWLRYGTTAALYRRRIRVAFRHVRGEGIEIGALHRPLRLPGDVLVRYVDRLTQEDLRNHYPELASETMQKVDVVEDGETLASFLDSSLDFVIANHVIEHCEDPIRTISNWLRVVRPGGVVYVAVPDKRVTFDHLRPITSSAHVLRDRREGPQYSRTDHYKEWASLVDGLVGAEAELYSRDLEEARYSIHFHVWDAKAFRDFLVICQHEISYPFEIRDFVRNRSETIAVLRRMSSR